MSDSGEPEMTGFGSNESFTESEKSEITSDSGFNESKSSASMNTNDTLSDGTLVSDEASRNDEESDNLDSTPDNDEITSDSGFNESKSSASMNTDDTLSDGTLVSDYLDSTLEEETIEIVVDRSEVGQGFLQFDVAESETVAGILNQVANSGSFSIEDYTLSIDGKILKDHTVTLKDAGITIDTRLRLVERPFQVFIRALAGNTMTVNVRASDTIKFLKQRYEEMHQVPINEQRLLFEGRQLSNTDTLKKCKITKGCKLDMVYRLKGGCA